MRKLPWLIILVLWLVAMAAILSAPKEPPTESEKVRFGRILFFDPVVSHDGKVSCSTCHIPERGLASGGLPVGLDGKPLARQAPSIFNRSKGKTYFWDGRAATLEEQALGPILNPKEMGNKNMDEVVDRVNRKFGIKVSAVDILTSLASFEEVLESPETRFDRYLRGESVLSESEARGWNLFRGRAECYQCHTKKSPFTDEDFHNTGIGNVRRLVRGEMHLVLDDVGRAGITNKEADIGKFKTPGLRGVRLRAPYMHDASLNTLEDVVEFYARGGINNKYLDEHMRPLRLSPRDKADLVAFLKGL